MRYLIGTELFFLLDTFPLIIRLLDCQQAWMERRGPWSNMSQKVSTRLLPDYQLNKAKIS